MTRSLVSVVVIFYDDERFLAEAIESVLAQTYPHWELILADDGSSDASTAIARRYATTDPQRIRYVEHPGHVNRGISATRNLGIAVTGGDYVAFLDSDDVWEPHKLAEQVAILEAHPDVGLVIGASLYWHSWSGEAASADRLRPIGAPQDAVARPPELATRLYPLGKGVAPCPSTILVRRELLQRVGGFEAHMPGLYDDQGFLAKAYLQTPVYVSSTCWDRYRRHADAITLTSSEAQYHAARRYFLEWYEEYLTERDGPSREIRTALRRAWLPYRHPRIAAGRHRLGVARARASGISGRVSARLFAHRPG